jgi:KEOPS complex subunit Pcc1
LGIIEGVETELEMKFETQHDAVIVLRSVEPEIRTAPSERTSANINVSGNVLKIKIDAEDTTSLRASLNSYLRWVKLSYEILELKKLSNKSNTKIDQITRSQ